MKFITFVKLTDEGRKHLPDAKEVLRRVYELTESFDGKIVSMWATTGRYDFISVAEYPTAEMALKAHTKLLEFGYFLVESSDAFDMETFLAAV
jgi:uncharacterized protein with GYD domain